MSASTNNELNIATMKAELKQLIEQCDELALKRHSLAQKIAEAQSAFPVGARVTYEGANHVWQITGVRPGFGNEPKYIGLIIKKDGTPGKNKGEIYVPWKTALRAA